MSEFRSPSLVRKILTVAAVTGAAFGTAACEGGASPSSTSSTGTENTATVTRSLWDVTWTATYRNPVTGETRVIPYGNRTESFPDDTTCPATFEVQGGETWELVNFTCANFSIVPITTEAQPGDSNN